MSSIWFNALYLWLNMSRIQIPVLSSAPTIKRIRNSAYLVLLFVAPLARQKVERLRIEEN